MRKASQDKPAELRPNLRPRRGGRLAVPTVLQMETTECGAACLGMILAYHGRWVPLEVLRVRCGVSRDGSNAANMVRAARELGLTAGGFRSERQHLFDLPFPMIAFWEFNHFVVLEGIEGARIYINDPSEGPRRLSSEEFEESFTGMCLAFEPGPEFRRSGGPPSVLRGLSVRFGGVWSPLAFAALATLALVVPGVAVPAMIKVFIDDVLIGQDGSWMAPLLIGLALAAAVRGALTWLQRAMLARMETKLSIVTTTRFFWHVATLPMVFFSQRYAGDIASRVLSNDAVARLLSGELAVNAINVVAMVFYAVVMLSYDVPLTLIAMIMAAINLMVLRLAARARENANRRLLKERGRVAGASINGIRIIETLKANGTENDFFARWSGMHANALTAQQRLGLVTTLANVVPPLLAFLSVIAILGVGGLRILDGALTIGGLIAFQFLMRSFSQPVQGLVRFGANLQMIKGDIARLDDVLKYEPDERTLRGVSEREPVGALVLADLAFEGELVKRRLYHRHTGRQLFEVDEPEAGVTGRRQEHRRRPAGAVGGVTPGDAAQVHGVEQERPDVDIFAATVCRDLLCDHRFCRAGRPPDHSRLTGFDEKGEGRGELARAERVIRGDSCGLGHGQDSGMAGRRRGHPPGARPSPGPGPSSYSCCCGMSGRRGTAPLGDTAVSGSRGRRAERGPRR